MKSRLFTTKGHLRPQRSEAIPKVIAPTLRSIRTRVIPQVMSLISLSNSDASCDVVRETVKKSSASRVHPKNAT